MNQKISLSYLLYLLGVACTIITIQILTQSYLFGNNEVAIMVMKYISMILLVLSIFCRRKWKNTEFLAAVALMIIIIVLFAFLPQKTLAIYLILIIGAWHHNVYSILRNILIMVSICTFWVVSASLLEFIPNVTFNHLGSIANSFGYTYYNMMPYNVLYMTVIGYVLLDKKSRKMKFDYKIITYLIFSALLNWIAFKLSTVRLSFICFLVFTASVLAFSACNCISHEKFSIVIATIMYPVMALLTFFLTVNFYNEKYPWIKVLNELLSARIHLSHVAFEKYPLRLFGNQLEFVTQNISWQNQYFYVDVGYVYTLVGSGIIIFCVVILGYILISRYTVKTKDAVVFSWCITVSIFASVNNCLLSPTMNPLLLFLPTAFEYFFIKKPKNRTHTKELIDEKIQ